MDSAAHGASSSSPSDNHTVVTLQPKGRRSDEYKLILDSGASFLVHRSAVAQAGLYEGITIDGLELDRLIRETELLHAREKALDLVARREHSRRELEQKLRRKRFPEDAVRSALDELEQRGILDDHRFARLWAETRLRRRPEGRVQVIAGLVQRGVAREVAERCVAEVYEQRTALVNDALRRAAERAWRAAGCSFEPAVRRLVRRGFGFGESRDAIARLSNLEKNDFYLE